MGERNKILMKFGYRLQKLKEFASCSAFHSNVFKQMADLRCTVARFANSYLTKEGTRGRNRPYPVKEQYQHPFLITPSFPRKQSSFRKIINIK